MTIDKAAVFVAYYRVSTEKQGVNDEPAEGEIATLMPKGKKERGLGIDAQKTAIGKFVGTGKLIAEFTEVESGKRHANRPQLLAALAECRKRRATLLIARLDRLARNVAFISSLMESGTDFIACDMPSANRLTIHILAAVAEHEREMISSRTKLALAEVKKRGKVLGNPNLAYARQKSLEISRASAPDAHVMEMMKDWRKARCTYLQIAGKLNQLNIKPARGKQWYGSSVRDQLIREAK